MGQARGERRGALGLELGQETEQVKDRKGDRENNKGSSSGQQCINTLRFSTVNVIYDSHPFHKTIHSPYIYCALCGLICTGYVFLLIYLGIIQYIFNLLLI